MSSPSCAISVLIGTRNRAESLDRTFSALKAQNLPGKVRWEIVVVDNGSKDQTKAVVESRMADFNGCLRYVHEPRPGLPYARNTGVQESRGALVVFTDDDVIPEPDWLAALLEACETHQADSAYGKILPVWAAPKPAWLGKRLMNKLAILDHGEEPFIVSSEATRFFGANFCVRRNVLARVGLFNVHLTVGQDTDYFLRLFAAKVRIVYQPKALVHHAIPAERMTKAYFKKWHYNQGRAQAGTLQLDGARTIAGIPLWSIRRFGRTFGQYLGTRFSQDADLRIDAKARLWHYAGLFTELRRLRGSRR